MKKEIMYCRNCGKPVPLDSKFCQHCGMAVTETTTTPPQEPQAKSAKPNSFSRKQFILSIIAVLVLTAVCSPLVFIGRNLIKNSLLNPVYRTQIYTQRSDNADSLGSESTTGNNSQNSSENESEDTVSPTLQPTIASTEKPHGIQVSPFRRKCAWILSASRTYRICRRSG